MTKPHLDVLCASGLALILTIAAAAPSARAVDPDPESYLVPSAWREKARALVDPGQSGLAGMTLRDIKLGSEITATYSGPTGELVVRVVPARVAPAEAVWKGERLAIVPVSATVDDATRAKALGRLESLLKGRDKAWGWLRRTKTAEQRTAEAAASKEARALGVAARRAAWCGSRREMAEAVAGLLEEKVQPDLASLLLASKAAYHAEAWELGREAGKLAKGRALKAASADHVDKDVHDRTRVTLALASALSGDTHHARDLSRSLVKGSPEIACGLVGVAEALEKAGETEVGLEVLNLVQAAAPKCDDAWRAEIRMVQRQGKAPEAATKAADEAKAARPGSALVRVSTARLALAQDRMEDAAADARVGVLRSFAAGNSLTMLVLAGSAGAVAPVDLGRWDMRAAREKDTLDAVAFGAAGCLARGDGECAAPRIAWLAGRPEGQHSRDLGALRAFALALAGQADEGSAALAEAWDAIHVGPAHVAAEAQLAVARERREDAVALWKAYIRALEWGPGPISASQAKVRIAALERPAPAPGATPSPSPAAPQPAPSPEPGTDLPWVWIVVGLIGLVGAGALLARRKGGDAS